MKKLLKKTGFTLVELLVVIAIIGMLAAMVLPAMQDSLLKGKLVKLQSNGKTMYQKLVEAETSDAYIASDNYWPGRTSEEKNSSTAYFNYLADEEVFDMAVSFYSAPGVPASTGSDLDEAGNAWCAVECIDDDDNLLPDSAPLFFTRNLNIDSLKSVDSPKSAMTTEPFMSEGFVFVTKGGQAYNLKKKELKKTTFNVLFDATNPTNNSVDLGNDILRP
jgi:type IV pilus assembly protein PilA